MSDPTDDGVANDRIDHAQPTCTAHDGLSFTSTRVLVERSAHGSDVGCKYHLVPDGGLGSRGFRGFLSSCTHPSTNVEGTIWIALAYRDSDG